MPAFARRTKVHDLCSAGLEQELQPKVFMKSKSPWRSGGVTELKIVSIRNLSLKRESVSPELIPRPGETRHRMQIKRSQRRHSTADVRRATSLRCPRRVTALYSLGGRRPLTHTCTLDLPKSPACRDRRWACGGSSAMIRACASAVVVEKRMLRDQVCEGDRHAFW